MLWERGFSESGRQKFGMLLSQSVQSCLRTENDRIKAAMAIVDGANSIDVVSKNIRWFVVKFRRLVFVTCQLLEVVQRQCLTFPKVGN